MLCVIYAVQLYLVDHQVVIGDICCAQLIYAVRSCARYMLLIYAYMLLYILCAAVQDICCLYTHICCYIRCAQLYKIDPEVFDVWMAVLQQR